MYLGVWYNLDGKRPKKVDPAKMATYTGVILVYDDKAT